jgi:beta-glucosidase
MEKKIDDGEKLICDLTSYNLVSLSTKGEGQWWVDRFKSILDEKKQKPNSDLILIGNSIFNSLSEKQHDRKDVWGKYLDKYNTINMGISGDRTENVIWRIENGMLDGINPKVAMVLIGTNNTDGNHYMSINSPEELSQGIIKICDLIHEKLPNTQIILMGILPYGYNPNLRDEINKSTNGILKNYFLSDNRESPVYYVDLRNHFVDHKGNAKHDLLYDYLHPNLKGHLLMFNLLNTYLLDKIGY